MPIEFNSKIASTSRVVVRQTEGADGSGPVFSLSKPSRAARVGRAALNVVSHLFCFIPGVKYTKNIHNPKQWAAFRNAVMATHADQLAPKGNLTEAKLKDILGTYSHHKRLTQGKAAAVLADVQRVVRGEALAARKPKRLNASQFAPGRGLRTLAVRLKGLRDDERAVLQQVSSSKDPRADTVRDILRPGRTMLNTSVRDGQEALERHAAACGANFDWSSRGMDEVGLKTRLNEVLSREGSKIEKLRQAARQEPSKPALLSIPVILFPKAMGLHEQHVVELAVDFRHNKLLYLDSKGESIEEAGRNYNSGNVAEALKAFGEAVFEGQGWNPQTGIVQMTQAKQQGANDCGAFTHDFTRRLINGQSVGDIERDFDADDRRELRINMAKDIAQPLIEAPGQQQPAGNGEQDIGQTSQDELKAQPQQSVSEPENPDDFFELRRSS